MANTKQQQQQTGLPLCLVYTKNYIPTICVFHVHYLSNKNETAKLATVSNDVTLYLTCMW